ncbi:unnamed protein product [Arabis nemorensis]|uniref:Uncharacterized protein n=1 Tax=Arabis nemorensis TaxID=586526 RepID=A0A565CS63_9BRAS|nr:unnamed protein product [Arabis nemorensis]
MDLSYASLLPDCYKRQAWIATYDGTIQPHAAASDVQIPEHISQMCVFPPQTKIPLGRRRKTRFPSTEGEYNQGFDEQILSLQRGGSQPYSMH